ncbi:polyphosphate polymerase domain-containing protein [Salibacterium aidingense]|uniref:polyphosphate polymerase domain-containing protein n=1 Tax=Salibacterium aidingense TaxID=384933 RepID=UPI003BBD77AA
MSSNLTFRHELKYYVPYPQYHTIRQRLKHLMTSDYHAREDGDYHVRSLYFDDIYNKALFEKQAGISDREKYRIRIYNLKDDVVQVEKKIKKDKYIAKLKETISRDTAENLADGNFHPLKNSLGQQGVLAEIYEEMKNNMLRPNVIVDYIREAYTAEAGNVRITFDKSLRTGLHQLSLFRKDIPTVPAMDEDFIILEVKYDEFLPDYIKIALQAKGIRREAASKYVICRKYTKLNAWEDQ